MKVVQSRLKSCKIPVALFLLFVWCLQLVVPQMLLAGSAQNCVMPCCLMQMRGAAPRPAESSRPEPSCCPALTAVATAGPEQVAGHERPALATPAAGLDQPAGHGTQTCATKLCAQGQLFIAAAGAEAIAHNESGIKYLLLQEEQLSVKYSAKLFRPPRARSLF